MVKFMQQLDKPRYNKLKHLAKSRGIGVQEYLRAVVIPDHLEGEERKQKALKNGQAKTTISESTSRVDP